VIVVSNSSPLIALSQIGRLDLLGQLQPQILIPPAVAKKVRPSVLRLPDWIEVKPLSLPANPAIVSSAIGLEREVIALGLELGAQILILDERPARRLATSLGLGVVGTVGLLLAAKDRGLLVRIKPELDRLLTFRFFIDEELYNRVLTQAGE
jgi:predicted nucleic acid-binding protein